MTYLLCFLYSLIAFGRLMAGRQIPAYAPIQPRSVQRRWLCRKH